MDKKLAIQIIHQVLFDQSSFELDELTLDLHINDEPLSMFCDRFDLGDWFYDQMTLAEVDIVAEVSVLADMHRESEREAMEYEAEVERDLRAAQS